MDKFLSRKRTFDDNKASTSAQKSIVPKIKSRKYSQEYLNFGFTITEVNGKEKPLCVICSKILAADSMKPNKLKRHFETLHARCKKPHTIAEELILPAAIEIVETMFGDNFAKELQSIPLSNDTVSRRIDDIAEDVEQQLFGKLRDQLFSIQLDEATDSNKDAHFIAALGIARTLDRLVSTVHKILRNNLHCYPYKTSHVQELLPSGLPARGTFALEFRARVEGENELPWKILGGGGEGKIDENRIMRDLVFQVNMGIDQLWYAVCSLQTHLEESCLPLSSERFSSPCCHTSEDKLGTGPSWDQSPIRSLVLSQRSQKVRWLGESGLQPRLSPSASGVDPQWPEFPMAFGLLDHDSIFVNECGNNALCYSESQRNFRLG
ncbi:protein FAM200B [Trichonephila clavipes]|uniref:Protein FAM200B n=1 Tax=Trichonephila clavipes TaxID=2585209 RepID=A0A8X7BL97_TRICX|nr:protein FAM200B [Trichonephila clavipes]